MMRNLSLTACRNNRLTALLMALAALGIGATAVALASILTLEACHLCIFQRLVYSLTALRQHGKNCSGRSSTSGRFPRRERERLLRSRKRYRPRRSDDLSAPHESLSCRQVLSSKQRRHMKVAIQT